MKKFRSYCSALLVAMAALFVVSCDNNDEIKVDPNANYDAVLTVNEGETNKNVDVTVNPTTQSSIKAKVSFTSTTLTMRRLYITQDIKGAGETIYKPSENIDPKADGSVDIEKSGGKTFEYGFTLPVPSGIGTNGTVVYKFWTTTGNGDFRDQSQRLAVGPGTITLKVGTATNPGSGEASVKSYSDVKLVAPLADGTSNTFVSLLDGKTYNVNQGIEYVSRWDFGYLYSTSTSAAATLRAPYNYPAVAIDIPTKASTTNEELNKIYFKKSTKTTTEFDAVTKSSDLDFVSVTNTEANLVVTNLVANDVVEFIDQYGNKGLIKVLQINGTNGSDGFIRIAIKVQP